MAIISEVDLGNLKSNCSITDSMRFYTNIIYFVSEEEGREGIEFLKLWRREVVKEMKWFSPAEELVSEMWIEKPSWGEEVFFQRGTIAVKLYFGEKEKSKYEDPQNLKLTRVARFPEEIPLGFPFELDRTTPDSPPILL